MKKRTMQVSIWTDDDERAADWYVALMAVTKGMAKDNYSFVTQGIKIHDANESREEIPVLRSAKVRGRMHVATMSTPSSWAAVAREA